MEDCPTAPACRLDEEGLRTQLARYRQISRVRELAQDAALDVLAEALMPRSDG